MTRGAVLTARVVAGQLRDGDPGAPPAPWWSLTKAVLGAAALALVAEGRLALDAVCERGPFTLRQLLQHTAGLPEYGALAEYHDAVARNDSPWSDDELWRKVEADRLRYPPGGGWAYSNVGYLLVRRTIERATGDELETALRRLVLGPLGVPGVRLARVPADLDATAWGNASGYHPGWVYHGLLVGTPAEAALFIDRLLTGDLLPPALRAEMRAPHALGDFHEAGRPWRTAGYGLGLMIDVASPRGRALGHTGGGPGSVSAAYHFPDQDPPISASAFAAGEDGGTVERAVVGLA